MTELEGPQLQPKAGSELLHLVLTRFNTKESSFRDKDRCGQPTDTDAWMDHRVALFEAVCYPSMKGQSNRDFTWLVFFHDGTSEKYRAKIQEWRELPNFLPVFVPAGAELRGEVVKRVPESVKRLITTRLDNDDALHREAVDVIRGHSECDETLVIDLIEGYFLHRSGVYEAEGSSNSFASLAESLGSQGFRTVWCCPHTELTSHFSARQVRTRRYWIQCLHDRNLVNRLPAPSGGQWGRRLKNALRNALIRARLWRGETATFRPARKSKSNLADIRRAFSLPSVSKVEKLLFEGKPTGTTCYRVERKA